MLTLNGKTYQNTDELFHDAIAMNLDISDIEKVKFDKYARLQKLGRTLQLPTPLAVLQIQVKNPNQAEHGILKISDSWVRNQYVIQHQTMALANWSSATFGSGLNSAKRTSGAICPVGGEYYTAVFYGSETSSGYYADANDATTGIVIGTGITAESLDSFALTTPIANGTGSGQMSFNACGVTKTWSSPTWTAAWVRIINNNSGGTITVNECALYAYLFSGYTHGFSNTLHAIIMTNRDKLASGEDILDAGQLTVTYNNIITYA